MTNYLWSKSSAGNENALAIQHYMSGQDIILDREIFIFDLRATTAHAAGLNGVGILNDDEFTSIVNALNELGEQFLSGKFILEAPFEDGHSAIELWLTEKLPDAGPKVHTGRSRNDQVQVAMRMYLRHSLDQLRQLCLEIAGSFLTSAEQDELTPMPGYTHLQRAVPSSVGLWMGGFAESFLDIADLVAGTREWINSCPLGTAAGYGVNLELDRQAVSDSLEFSRLQVNPMYVQNSRGRFELQALSVLAQATMELRRFAWDLSLFTTQEYQFVTLPDGYRTGSSIMPNKSNPDFVELLRGQHAIVQGAMSELQALLSLPSGYQRDLQLTKPPVIRAFSSSLLAMSLVVDLPTGMTLHRETMLKAIDPELYSTDIAIERVTDGGMSFRDAYRKPVSEADLVDRTPEKSLEARISPGACGDLQLDQLRARLAAQPGQGIEQGT